VTAILLATLSSGKTLSWGKRVLAIALFSATAFGAQYGFSTENEAP
jgi:hypothetical protein